MPFPPPPKIVVACDEAAELDSWAMEIAKASTGADGTEFTAIPSSFTVIKIADMEVFWQT